MIVGILFYLVGRGIFIGIKKQVYWLKEIIRFLFVVYLCMVVSVTLFPIPVGFNSEIESIYRTVNLIPLKSIIFNFSQIGIAYGGDTSFMIGLIARNVGGNILLLMPLGFFVPLLWNKLNRFKSIFLVGFSVSISIELLQYIEPKSGGWGRVTDIDDVICNVFGVIIGYLIYKMVFKLVNKF